MDVLLKLGLGIALVIAAVVGVVAIAFIVVFLKNLKAILAGTPSRIHLRSSASAKWNDLALRDMNRQELHAIGFADIDSYTVDEMPMVPINAFVKHDENLMAVLYEHPQVGQWIDMVAEFEDGGTITVSNAVTGHELEHRPGHEKVYLIKEPIAAVYARAREICSGRVAKPVPETSEAFIAKFEKAYADDMDWRNSRGGPTTEEIRRVAEASGMNADEKTIQKAREIQENQAYHALVGTLIETLRGKGTIPEAQGKDFEDSLLFVHDNMSQELLDKLLSDVWLPSNEAEGVRLKSHPSVREAFARWNESLPTDRRFQKIGAVSEPTPVDVYKSRVRKEAENA